MKFLKDLFLMATIIALTVLNSAPLYAGENCDSLNGKYVYQFKKTLIVRGSLNRAYFEQPFGFSNFNDTLCSIYIQLNGNQTFEKWSISQVCEKDPGRPEFKRKELISEGYWTANKDTLTVRLMGGDERYLILNDQLVQLGKKYDGTFIATDKHYKGEPVKVFTKERKI